MKDMQYRLKMKDLPLCERPYEKLEKYGAQMLSNAELLAIIIRTGTKTDTSVTVAQKLLKQDDGDNGLVFLHDITLEQLREINGIGKVKAIQIKAIMELSKRISSTFNKDKKAMIKSPDDICMLFMEEMRHLKKEIFKIVLLNTKNRIINHIDISIGSLNASIVHPREVFVEAVKRGCSCILLVHNHPSGDPEPSKEDVDTTNRLVNAGNIIGIRIIDHIIIGDGKYLSFKEKGLINS